MATISTANRVKQPNYFAVGANGIIASIGNNNIGRVVGVILNENSPGINDSRVNGINDIGAIFYTQYIPGTSNITVIPEKPDEIVEFLKNPQIQVAKPITTNIKEFPLIGELVLLVDGPSTLFSISVESKDKKIKYYQPIPISVWNSINTNTEFNNQIATGSSKYFTPSSVSPLLPFEGDQIIEGRSGHSIRFGSSNIGNDNWWKNANSGDPITIINNGQKKTGSIEPIIESLTDFGTSNIILSSTQYVPIKPKYTANPITSTPNPEYYNSSQVILNADKIVLNSKDNDIVSFSNNNIETYATNYVTLNAGEAISFNSKKILLGQNNNSSIYPSQPAVLGGNLHAILISMIDAIQRLSTDLKGVKSTSVYDSNIAGQFNVIGENLKRINKSLKLLKGKNSTPLSNVVYLKNNV
jgi:uncharacterized protein with HEPN domain